MFEAKAVKPAFTNLNLFLCSSREAETQRLKWQNLARKLGFLREKGTDEIECKKLRKAADSWL